MENARRKIARVKNDRVHPNTKVCFGQAVLLLQYSSEVMCPWSGSSPYNLLHGEPPLERGIPFSGLRYTKG